MKPIWPVLLLMSLCSAFGALAPAERVPDVEVAAAANAGDAGAAERGGPKHLQIAGDRSNGRSSNVTPGVARPRSTARRCVVVSAILREAFDNEDVSPHCERLPYDATAPPTSL